MARSVRRSAAAPRVCVALLSNLKAHRDKLRGVLAYGRSRGWRVDLADGTAFSVRLDRAADAAAYDGFVVSRDSMLPPGWRRPGLPVVSLDAWLPGDPGPDVVCDADAVGALAARTLAAAGARAFAFLPMLALPETYAEERRRAFEAALRALGAPPPAVFRPARWGAWREEEPRLAAFLRALPRPAALFAANDIMGRFAVETALAAGLRVPEDLAVLGVDDDRDECLAASPPLSSIAIGFERAGRLAAALLERRMAGARRAADAPAAPVRYGPDGVVRRGSLPPPGGAAATARPADPRVERARRFIERRACDPSLRVADIAREMGLAPRRAQLLFREAGLSIRAAIRDARLAAVRERLERTSEPLARIAEACGFGSEFHLSRLFHRHFGMTARDFRRRLVAAPPRV